MILLSKNQITIWLRRLLFSGVRATCLCLMIFSPLLIAQESTTVILLNKSNPQQVRFFEEIKKHTSAETGPQIKQIDSVGLSADNLKRPQHNPKNTHKFCCNASAKIILNTIQPLLFNR
ncbi:MAG: hypothetical protein A6F71_05190 [Cycloclasticus sp. symbiont of Poecilosclerida sp. M]|nr:MAG: hypothetical protein A6F71_05190 [Cycloclasticus sp. symbiont of Poecilosclerida sp. M]